MVHLDFFDMGGQDVYHTTHQLFLSNNTLYLLVFSLIDAKSENKIDYWLQTLKAKVSASQVHLYPTN